MSQSRGVLDGTQSRKKGSIFMLPFFLLSYITSLSYILASSKDEDSIQQTYHRIPNRYSEYGWNRNSQQCYTDPEITLLQHINTAHKNLLDQKDDSEFFKYVEERSWYDWWHCTKPLYKDLMARLESGVFTLPSREKLDTKIFPLSNFADNMAKQIANWQRDRSENQDADRMNDPAMLMFEELKSWFLTDLTQQECRTETLDIIAKRLSYIKTLIHLIPDLGLDKPHLIEIQRSLDHASSLIKNCIANKELPQLSSDVGRATDSFVENAFNTLHFLGINEPVTDNFSIECLRNKPNTQASPICKIYKAAQTNSPDSPALYDYQGLHQFYNIVKLNDDAPATQVKLALRTEVAKDINFASFLNEKDKLNYIEAIATLDALINVRKILDKFHHLQSKLGTYVFAINYIDKANELARLYRQLITKARSKIQSLVTASDDGHEQILRSHDKSTKHAYFKKNLRTLETLVVAKGTTVTSQLELESMLAADSMAKYQRALTKLASDVNSGHAYEELKIAMQELDLQMRYMNTVLPSMLGETTLTLNEQSGIQLVACESNEPCAFKLIPTSPQAIVQESLPVEAISIPAASLNTHTSLTNFNLFAPKASESASHPNVMFDYGEWDAEIGRHPRTHAPIFTYRLYKNGYEVGSAVFYGQPVLCSDGQQNNIIAKYGILSEFDTEGMSIEETCASLPPTLFDQVLFSAGNGALCGMRNIIGATLKTYHFTERTAFAISQTAYYGALFSIKFSDYYQKLSELHDSNNAIDALYFAALETGQFLLINVTLTAANYLLTMIGDFFESYDWVRLGRCIKCTGSLIRFGFYAANSTSLIEAGTGMAAGAAAEKLTETTGNYLLGNH